MISAYVPYTIHMCIHIHTYTHTHAYIHIHIYTYIHIRMYENVHTYILQLNPHTVEPSAQAIRIHIRSQSRHNHSIPSNQIVIIEAPTFHRKVWATEEPANSFFPAKPHSEGLEVEGFDCGSEVGLSEN